jgi:hypothetical protein
VRRVTAVVLACAVSSATGADAEPEVEVSVEPEVKAGVEASVGADLATTLAALPACDAARAHCIGIRLHIAVAGSGPIAGPDWLASQLATANRHFAALDVGFRVVGIDALPASTAHIATRGDRDSLAAGGLGGGVIHAFIVGRLDDVDREGQIIRGVAWRTGKDKPKYVIISTAAPDRVLAHELGHVFGLPHSTLAISIMNKRERVRPPVEQRTFADEEIAAMRPVLQRLLRAGALLEI